LSSIVSDISQQNSGTITSNLVDDQTTTLTIGTVGTTRNEFAALEHNSKNRQNGTLYGIRMKVPQGLSDPNFVSITAAAWKPFTQGPTTIFTLISRTPDLTAKFTQPAGTVMDIIFDTPIANFEEGGIITLVVESTGSITTMFDTQAGLNTISSVILDDAVPPPCRS
jgi:hypothetical protein